MRLLVTGGAGFIGSHFIRFMLQKYPAYIIYNLDALTYAGTIHNLDDINSRPNHVFLQGNICDTGKVNSLLSQGIDAVVNFAAESHVDRSIQDSGAFIATNITGTHTLLQAAIKAKVKRFVQISTDEVYGSLEGTGFFTETAPLAPNNPYAASKAGADLLALSFGRTYGLPVVITRSTNNFGPYQHPEKFIPKMVTRALRYEKLPVYGDGLHVRDWLYVEDHCRAIDLALHAGRPGEVYNIGQNQEETNIGLASSILRYLGRPTSLITLTSDRPGHDRRYAVNAGKIRNELGWTPQTPFAEALRLTVEWYQSNPYWWKERCESWS